MPAQLFRLQPVYRHFSAKATKREIVISAALKVHHLHHRVFCFPLKTENTDTMQKQGELVSVKSAEWDIVFHESKNVSLHAAALS